MNLLTGMAIKMYIWKQLSPIMMLRDQEASFAPKKIADYYFIMPDARSMQSKKA